MANDPNTIQYVIQEDGFWYVASKDRTPGVPELTVSAKGVANGLSTEYNDGYDFGPDSYNPSITSGVPLTQTSGIEEAYNYLAAPFATPNPANPATVTIVLGEGNFYLNDNVTMTIGQTNGNSPYPAAVNIRGQGKRTTYVWINQVGLKGIVYNVPDSSYGVEDTVWSDFSLDIGYGQFGTNNVAANPTGSGADSMFEYFVPSSGGQGTLMSFIDMSFFSGSNTAGYGPTNGALYIGGDVNIISVNSTFEGDRIINFQGGAGTSFPPATYNAELFADFTGCFIGGSPVPAIFSGYAVSFSGVNITAQIVGGLSSGGQNVSFYFDRGTFIGNISVVGQVTYVVFNQTYLIGNNAPILRNGTTSSSANITMLIVDSCMFNGFSSTTFADSVTVSYISKMKNCYVWTGSLPVLPAITSLPSLSANPPASGTVYQNDNPYDIRIYLPAYATTSGTAGSVAIALGSSSTPSAIGTKYINGSTSSSATDIIELVVPAGWYYEFTLTGVTLGTATVFSA